MYVRLSNGRQIPVEAHKVKIVQRTDLPPVEQRLRAMQEAGYNTFLLRTATSSSTCSPTAAPMP